RKTDDVVRPAIGGCSPACNRGTSPADRRKCGGRGRTRSDPSTGGTESSSSSVADRRTRARRDRLPRVKEEVGRGFRVLRLEAYARSTVPASVLYWVEQVAERERGRRGPLSLVVPGSARPLRDRVLDHDFTRTDRRSD